MPSWGKIYIHFLRLDVAIIDCSFGAIFFVFVSLLMIDHYCFIIVCYNLQ